MTHLRLTKRELVYGVGVNDASYSITTMINSKQVRCKCYDTWHNMLSRAYCPTFKSKCPSYVGVQVEQHWLRFSNFLAWMLDQNWIGYHLDKDFLGTGKLYSEEGCVFIPQWLNKLFVQPVASRSLPTGVYWDKTAQKFQSYLKINGIRKTIASYHCPYEAHAAYVRAKTAYVRGCYKEIELIDKRLVPACERKLKALTGGIYANH